jgi:hypothetical protein
VKKEVDAVHGVEVDDNVGILGRDCCSYLPGVVVVAAVVAVDNCCIDTAVDMTGDDY